MAIKVPQHPLEVNLGHKKFKIVQRSLAKDNLYGCVEFPKATLTIDPNQSIEDYKSTLLHEICHIGFDLFGLGDDDEMPTIGNEYLTTVTSNMLFMIAAMNKELFEFIFDSTPT
jgi:hypothetical protein|tara:strand:+ start:223 stop:564 length:342 start_codon:yes stop_codon:yes gene_type:complete